MEIFGIGIQELLFAVIIALIVLGPKDMAKAGKTIGRFLNKVVRSDTYHVISQLIMSARTMPNRLMRDAGLDEIGPFSGDDTLSKQKTAEILKDYNLRNPDHNLSAWTEGQPAPPAPGAEPSILPPVDTHPQENASTDPPIAPPK